MSDTVIQIDHLYKEYRLGTIGSGTLYRDLQSWWAKLWGKDDPNSVISYHRQIGKSEQKELNQHILAINDVSCEVKKGDIVGVIGRNGSGKSTLLKILSRITYPTRGEVRISGRIGSLLEVGTGFHPELTGRENVFLNGAILGMKKSEIKTKLDEIVAFAEIDKFLDTPVKRYSSGMYVRLAFAVAAHLDPEILLVDEVLAVGDAQFQQKCLGKLENVSTKEGRTVLFVSHNMTAISLLCRKTLLLNQGKMVDYGPTDDVIAKYISMRRISQDLVERRDRIGNGAARCIQIEILNQEGRAADHIQIQESVIFSLRIQFRPEAIGKSIAITVIIVDEMENRICAFQNEVTGYPFTAQDHEHVFQCRIPEGLPFLPGRYSITYSVLVATSTADKIVSALEFDLVASDFYGTNNLPAPNLGHVLLKNIWKSV